MKTLVLLLAAVFCSYCMAEEKPFSINDLSILFPLDQATLVPKFPVQPGDAKWRVLSIENFKAVLKAAGDEQVFLTSKLQDPFSWYLVGMRYTPCTLFHGATPACKEQLRFIFQPLNAERGSGGYDDYAIHVVYNLRDLGRPQMSDRLESFRKIKNQFIDLTLDKPLAVHPALVSARGREYFEALQTEVIEKHVNHTHPSVITFIGLGSGGSSSDHWIFLSGNVDGTGKWAIAPLNVGAPLKSEHMKASDEDEFSLVSNITAGRDQINLFDQSRAQDETLAQKILDQRETNDHNVSCASCHVADARVFPVLFMSDDGERKAKFEKFAVDLLNTNPRATELLIENAVHIGKIGFEAPAVRIFGYLYDKVLLSERVVMDGALAAEQANKLLGLNPKPQCASARAKKDLVACLYLSRSATLAQCFQQACRH